jgi:hypothetical protein
MRECSPPLYLVYMREKKLYEEARESLTYAFQVAVWPRFVPLSLSLNILRRVYIACVRSTPFALGMLKAGIFSFNCCLWSYCFIAVCKRALLFFVFFGKIKLKNVDQEKCEIWLQMQSYTTKCLIKNSIKTFIGHYMYCISLSLTLYFPTMENYI